MSIVGVETGRRIRSPRSSRRVDRRGSGPNHRVPDKELRIALDFMADNNPVATPVENGKLTSARITRGFGEGEQAFSLSQPLFREKVVDGQKVEYTYWGKEFPTIDEERSVVQLRAGEKDLQFVLQPNSQMGLEWVDEKGKVTASIYVHADAHGGSFNAVNDYIEIERASIIIAGGASGKTKVAISEDGTVGKIFLTGDVDLITKKGTPSTNPYPHGVEQFHVTNFRNKVNGYTVDHLGNYTAEEFGRMTLSQVYYGRYVDFTDPTSAEQRARWKKVNEKLIEQQKEAIAQRTAEAEALDEAKRALWEAEASVVVEASPSDQPGRTRLRDIFQRRGRTEFENGEPAVALPTSLTTVEAVDLGGRYVSSVLRDNFKALGLQPIESEIRLETILTYIVNGTDKTSPQGVQTRRLTTRARQILAEREKYPQLATAVNNLIDSPEPHLRVYQHISEIARFNADAGRQVLSEISRILAPERQAQAEQQRAEVAAARQAAIDELKAHIRRQALQPSTELVTT